jgi:hypothetical protein
VELPSRSARECGRTVLGLQLVRLRKSDGALRQVWEGQFHIIFKEVESDGNTLKLCRVDNYAALSRHFVSLVQDDQQLMQLALRIDAQGRVWLGDIVRLNHQEVFELLDYNRYAFERLLTLLEGFDLQLNLAVSPKWKRPDGSRRRTAAGSRR